MLTEIIPNVQISSEQSLRFEAAQKSVFHAFNEPVFAAQKIRQRTGVTLTARSIVPFNDGIYAIAQLMLYVGRSNFGSMYAWTSGTRWRSARFNQFLAVDGARHELADQ